MATGGYKEQVKGLFKEEWEKDARRKKGDEGIIEVLYTRWDTKGWLTEKAPGAVISLIKT